MAGVRYGMGRGLLAMGMAVVMGGSARAQTIGPDELNALVSQCAPCHGVDGHARDVEVPHLAGQHDRYLWNQLIAFRKGTRRHQDMRFMSRALTEPEIEALVVYYSGLPR